MDMKKWEKGIQQGSRNHWKKGTRKELKIHQNRVSIKKWTWKSGNKEFSKDHEITEKKEPEKS